MSDTQEATQETKPEPGPGPVPAGWAWPINLNRAHWFPGSTLEAICGRAMIWTRDMLDTDAAENPGRDGPGKPGRDDCRACWRAITDPKWGRAPRAQPVNEESGDGKYRIEFYAGCGDQSYRLVRRTEEAEAPWSFVMWCPTRRDAVKASKADALMRAGVR